MNIMNMEANVSDCDDDRVMSFISVFLTVFVSLTRVRAARSFFTIFTKKNVPKFRYTKRRELQLVSEKPFDYQVVILPTF